MPDTTAAEKKYFAAANSCCGFKSYYHEIFKGFNKLYIIKGGPGTGKSKLMRDVANEARNKNYDVEYFYCSSDPSSLDGIIIHDLSVGVLDGTAPHTMDPIYPGACDEIINLGDFWKSDKLAANKLRISEYIDRKSALFISVYHYLAAADMMDGELRKMTLEAVNQEKLTAAATRITREFKNGNGFRRELRILDSIGMEGEVCFDTFYELAERHYLIRDKYNIAYLLLRAIINGAESRKQPVIVSHSPLNLEYETAVYLPELRTAFTIERTNSHESASDDDKIINMDRFIDADFLRRHRAKLRFGKRCLDSLMEGAIETLGEIKRLHFELEDIYVQSMDFRRKEEYTKKLLIKIFK